MFNIARALKQDRLLRAVTGTGTKEFERLLKVFAPLAERKRYKKNRKRKGGAGRKHSLKTSEQKLFFILFYMKCYPTYDLAGLFFGVDKAQCFRWMQQLKKKLEKALGREWVLPKRRISSMEEFIQLFPEAKEIIIDGTERPVQRPGDKQKQKQRYSGKKKRHTQKNILITNRKKEIRVLTPTRNGREHDYTLLKKSKLPEIIPKKIKAYLDLGFKGIDKDYSLHIVMPFRKPRTRDLTAKQKTINKKINRVRVLGEHAIAGIKRFRCLTDVCRTKIEKTKDDWMLLASGLWNFHLKVA